MTADESARRAADDLLATNAAHPHINARGEQFVFDLFRRAISDARPKWTTEAPTRPGWYWFRRRGETGMVHIVHNCRENTLVFLYPGPCLHLPLDAEWCGPLEAPS